jgi:hypothetical protein
MGNHTVAIVKCQEDHQILKYSLATVINDVNGITYAEGFLTVDGVKLKLDISFRRPVTTRQILSM